MTTTYGVVVLYIVQHNRNLEPLGWNTSLQSAYNAPTLSLL